MTFVEAFGLGLVGGLVATLVRRVRRRRRERDEAERMRRRFLA